MRAGQRAQGSLLVVRHGERKLDLCVQRSDAGNMPRARSVGGSMSATIRLVAWVARHAALADEAGGSAAEALQDMAQQAKREHDRLERQLADERAAHAVTQGRIAKALAALAPLDDMPSWCDEWGAHVDSAVAALKG